MKIKKGFTLAETLIAMAVLGIVAAITVPILVQTTNKNMYVDGLKKATIMLKAATGQLMLNNGGTMANLIAADGDYVSFLNKYCSQLNCVKNCGTGTGCFPNVTYKYLDGTNWANIDTGVTRAKAILANGFSIFVWNSTAACTTDGSNGVGATSPFYYTCGNIAVDVNGFKGPNQYGRDIFQFRIARTGIFPYGINGDAFAGNCTTTGLGSGCSGKVLTEGAMNY